MVFIFLTFIFSIEYLLKLDKSFKNKTSDKEGGDNFISTNFFF